MPIGYTLNNSNNTDYRSNDEKDDNVEEEGVGEEGKKGGSKRKQREMIVLKSEPKADDR